METPMPLPEFELSALELKELAPTEMASAPATARVAVGADDFLLRLCVDAKGNPRLFSRVDALDSPVFQIVNGSYKSSHALLNLLKNGDSVLPSLFENFTFTLWQKEMPEPLRKVIEEGNWRRNVISPATERKSFVVCIDGKAGVWFVDEKALHNKTATFEVVEKNYWFNRVVSRNRNVVIQRSLRRRIWRLVVEIITPDSSSQAPLNDDDLILSYYTVEPLLLF